jgi:hypothetical protein
MVICRAALHNVEQVRICGDPTYVKKVALRCDRIFGKSNPKKAKQNKMKKQKGDERRETRSFSYRKMSRNMHVKCQRKEGMIEVKVQARQKNKHDSHIERHLRFIKGLAIIT